MKGLSGKRKLSFLGTGLNIAFMEIFKYPFTLKGENFTVGKFQKNLALNPLIPFYLYGVSGTARSISLSVVQ